MGCIEWSYKMTKYLAIVTLLAFSACTSTWPHNETPQLYRLENNVWTDLGEIQ